MKNNPFSLDGKSILITGASGDIGQATAVECAKMGARVILTGRNEERLVNSWNEVNKYSNNDNIYHVCDLSDFNSIKNLVSRLTVLNGIVFNAGISKLVPIKFIKETEFKEILNVNLVSSAIFLKEILKQKKINDGASVVFTSSAAGLYDPIMGNAMYSASKGAVCAFAKNAALELAGRNIRVNAVCPGMVDTKMIKHNEGLEYSDVGGLKRYPLKRYAKPEEIAYAFVYLLSDASAWITGTDFIIDGGLRIG